MANMLPCYFSHCELSLYLLDYIIPSFSPWKAKLKEVSAQPLSAISSTWHYNSNLVFCILRFALDIYLKSDLRLVMILLPWLSVMSGAFRDVLKKLWYEIAPHMYKQFFVYSWINFSKFANKKAVAESGSKSQFSCRMRIQWCYQG